MPDPAYVSKWYEVVEDASMRQGDLFRDLLVFWPSKLLEPVEGDPPAELKVPFDWVRGDFTILSASCDVDQAAYPFVLLARVLPVSKEQFKCKEKELPQHIEVLGLGLVPSMFLLPAYSEIEPTLPLSFVNYRTHALLPIQYLRKHCVGKRLRLRSPHRERLGAWAGANLSRIGPENDALIPRLTQVFPAHVLAANAGQGEGA